MTLKIRGNVDAERIACILLKSGYIVSLENIHKSQSEYVHTLVKIHEGVDNDNI